MRGKALAGAVAAAAAIGALVAMAGPEDSFAQTAPCYYARELDVDGSGVVDILDLTLYVTPVRRYGAQAGETGYDVRFDQDRDGSIGLTDLVLYRGRLSSSASTEVHAKSLPQIIAYEVTLTGATRVDFAGNILGPGAETFLQLENEPGLAGAATFGAAQSGDGLFLTTDGSPLSVSVWDEALSESSLPTC